MEHEFGIDWHDLDLVISMLGRFGPGYVIVDMHDEIGYAIVYVDNLQDYDEVVFGVEFSWQCPNCEHRTPWTHVTCVNCGFHSRSR